MTDKIVPLVSVVIPLFNKRATVERAVRSILNQQVDNVEIIVVDDGSTDGSPDLVASLALPNLRLLRQPNGGPGSARNTGVAASQALLVAFLDADDEWLSGFLSAALNALQTSEAIAYVCGYDAGEYRSERPNKVALLGKTSSAQSPPFSLSGPLLKTHVDAMHSSCVVIRKDQFSTRGGFFTEQGCRFGEDSWLWGQIVLSETIFWDPAEYVRFHVEDSDLGYATVIRRTARPITQHPSRFIESLPGEAEQPAQRLIATFAMLDYHNLVLSKSWTEASRMRRLHRLNGTGGLLKELMYRGRSAIGLSPQRR